MSRREKPERPSVRLAPLSSGTFTALRFSKLLSERRDVSPVTSAVDVVDMTCSVSPAEFVSSEPTAFVSFVRRIT